jgi:hypothetical protein
MDLLSDTEKNDLQIALNDIHDTWKRSATFYKKPEEVIISTNNDHNFLFDDAPDNTTIQLIQQSGVFDVRIFYQKRQTIRPFADGTSNELKLDIYEGEVRLKVGASGHAFLQDTERVVFDGYNFTIADSERPHGLFNNEFYTYYLKRVN